ncbi:uncharacterized protein BCR38DRAFT_347618 [Pseudomassariella vexata]|uniref:Uncharacterized protein n=1 Tax=Pseudomassariella vexata TaxID=1141098 RepID=A0A1Y2DQM4_9PEZI|nr:uncharacterized protein BCR38DRAFT_347618 [Pseudomassariella vexata]ORY61406.1 hypothetical protein BCR38DRAFT_347618 [Pseudomassariella vexata]
MKAFFTLFAFGSLIASTIANPIGTATGLQKRQDEDYSVQEASLNDLFAKIQEQTGAINKTVATAPDSPTDDEANAFAAEIAPQLEAITALLNTATASYSAKRDVVDSRTEKCDKTCIFGVITILIWEILGLVKFLIFKLGLACVLIYLQPLVLALVGLIKALDIVIGSLLFAVGGIVNQLLAAVGLGLLGLS